MSNLIDVLKDDHRQILEILEQVKKLGIETSTGREKLLSAKTLLLSHIRKEDERFYPALSQAAEQNDSLKHTLKYFSDDMEQVSRKAMDLFDKYAGGAFADEFPGEIKLLYMTLKDRIRTEEEVLFKKYEQIGEAGP
jgi:hemerythrin-like domain-containing protein